MSKKPDDKLMEKLKEAPAGEEEVYYHLPEGLVYGMLTDGQELIEDADALLVEKYKERSHPSDKRRLQRDVAVLHKMQKHLEALKKIVGMT